VNIEPRKTQGTQGDSPPVQRPRPGGSTHAVSGPSTPPGTVTGSRDDLVLSARAQEFRKVRPRIDSLPTGAGVRRLAELKVAIEKGTYRIDTVRVAEAVLRDEIVGPLLGSQPE
jgi:anti-sigma28 factor (negative regulator of flagellin synthesis)